MGNILEQNEIELILHNAQANPALRQPYAIGFGNGRTTIMKITFEKGLIVIKGDEDTGFTHINNRHSYWSKHTFWRPENETKIDTPSRFGRTSIPIIDYVAIIDELFCAENINLEKNGNPEIFDMYSGFASSENLEEAEYHMLIYKNTKIVHTLYPCSRKSKKKKIIDYERGEPFGDFSLNPLQYIIITPYSDRTGKVIYSFQVHLDYGGKIETGSIINHELDKSIVLYEVPLDKVTELNQLLTEFEIRDMSPIERKIKEFDAILTTAKN